MICVDIAKNALFTSFGIINFADSKLLDISRLHAICGMYVLLILVACASQKYKLLYRSTRSRRWAIHVRVDDTIMHVKCK